MEKPKSLQTLLGKVCLVDETGNASYGTTGSLLTDTSKESAQVDAFSRLRVSTPVTMFEGLFRYGRELMTWEEETAGAGVIDQPTQSSAVILHVGTASGDKAARQTKQYIPYDAGKSRLCLMTGILGPEKLNVQSRIGYFDKRNGVFFEQDGPVVNPAELAAYAFPGSGLDGNWTTVPAGGAARSA